MVAVTPLVWLKSSADGGAITTDSLFGQLGLAAGHTADKICTQTFFVEVKDDDA